jgi:Ca2+-binding EF-hand superfamily protein
MKRVIEVFDSDCSGEVDFKEFVLGLTELTCKPDEDWERKLQ